MFPPDFPFHEKTSHIHCGRFLLVITYYFVTFTLILTGLHGNCYRTFLLSFRCEAFRLRKLYIDVFPL